MENSKKIYKKQRWLLILPVALLIIITLFLIGPRPGKPDFSSLSVPVYSTDLKGVEDSLINAESSLPLKKDNEARIVWFKPYVKTEYAMVYLHGNGASQEEGDPIHEALAYRYGCNLFLARLADHGLQGSDPMLNINADDWMQSALDAIAIGHQLGEKVIIISTSTGSTLALYLASKFPDLVDGHVMLSPNVDLYDPRSFILTQPFGLQIAWKISGSEFYGWKGHGPAQSYWY